MIQPGVVPHTHKKGTITITEEKKISHLDEGGQTPEGAGGQGRVVPKVGVLEVDQRGVRGEAGVWPGPDERLEVQVAAAVCAFLAGE